MIQHLIEVFNKDYTTRRKVLTRRLDVTIQARGAFSTGIRGWVDVCAHASMYLSICQSVYQSSSLLFYLSISLSIYSSVYLSIFLSAYLSIFLSVCMSIFHNQSFRLSVRPSVRLPAFPPACLSARLIYIKTSSHALYTQHTYAYISLSYM